MLPLTFNIDKFAFKNNHLHLFYCEQRAKLPSSGMSWPNRHNYGQWRAASHIKVDFEKTRLLQEPRIPIFFSLSLSLSFFFLGARIREGGRGAPIIFRISHKRQEVFEEVEGGKRPGFFLTAFPLASLPSPGIPPSSTAFDFLSSLSLLYIGEVVPFWRVSADPFPQIRRGVARARLQQKKVDWKGWGRDSCD